MKTKRTIIFIKHFLILFIVSQTLSAYSQVQTDNSKIRKIVIDPGHGGKDPGAVGTNSYEKDVVLAIGLLLGEYVKKTYPEVEVIYTRDKDVFVELHQRAEIANKNHADLFISIHANSSTNTRAFGTETYVMGLHTDEKNLEVAKKENAVITLESDYTTKYEGYDPNSAESFVIFSLMQNTYLQQSLEIADNVQANFSKIAQRTDKGKKQAGFLVLWKTTMPAILIEIGFISNPKEEAFLSSTNGQDLLAQSIFKAFEAYKNGIESKTNYQTKVQTIVKERDTFLLDSIVLFKVQISSSSKQVDQNSQFLKNIKKIQAKEIGVEEIYHNNIYKYLIGSDTTYESCVYFSKQVKKHYPNAFIVATKNGKIIPLDEALKK